jgi:NADH-quinone oxidoreductase subunit D
VDARHADGVHALNSHLVWLGTHAIDIGAMSVFLYCFREREDILRIFEMFSGQRMMTSYFRIGGLALEPPRGWQKRVKDFIDIFPSRVDEYEELLTNNASGPAAPRASATFRSKTCSIWA